MSPAAGIAAPVLLAVLGAALLHALWNAMLKGRGDPLAATVLVAAGAAGVAVVLLPFLPAPAPVSWPFIAASSAVQTVYYLLLTATYRDGEISHAYPLMRGCAPPLVALANGALTGERLGDGQWGALLLICGGVLVQWLATRATPVTAAGDTATGRTPGAGTSQSPDPGACTSESRMAAARTSAAGTSQPRIPNARTSAARTTMFALLTAGVIAAYTLIDGRGVRLSGAPAAYTLWIFLLTGAAVGLCTVPGRARRLAAFARAHPLVAPLGGLATVGSYGIALWAMTRAPVAVVAALRETSILFATAIAAFILRERIGRMRLVAVALIACGAVAMRLA